MLKLGDRVECNNVVHLKALKQEAYQGTVSYSGITMIKVTFDANFSAFVYKEQAKLI